MKLSWLPLVLGVIAGQENNFQKGLIQTRRKNQELFSFASSGNAFRERISMENLTLMKFVLDFASRSRWESIVFFFSNSSELYNSLSPQIFNYFNAGGRFLAIRATSRPLLPQSVLHRRHHLGIVYFCDVIDPGFLNKVSELDLFDSYRFWLIITPDNPGVRLEIFNGLNVDLVTNLVVATLERKPIATTSPILPTAVATSSEFLVGYRKRQTEEEICSERRKRDSPGNSNLVVHLTQIYKASSTENETLSVQLGFWDVPNGMFKAKHFIHPEHRWNLGGYKISMGVKNSTREVIGNLANRFSFENEIDEEIRFRELSDCLMFGINASFEVIQFQKLGWRNEEGGWTHLLGAVVDGTVDFALETINPNTDKTQDMSFTYAIVITMNNIYFRRPKSSGLRDIFLAPFSPRLLLCVFATGLLLAIAMISITIVNYHVVEAKKPSSEFRILTRGRKERMVVITNKEERKWELSEAALWSISILCMQGSQWSPKSVSGSLLLINSLLFALIIYNSFAAFITSVLSVKDVKIKTLKDLADSDFAFGYTLGNADELFLRTVNDTLLRELYFKGLRENDGVSNPIEGMQRAATGKYAFFVGARTARRALQLVITHDRRCELQELYLSITRTFASIPVTRKSSLKKLLNYKIIRLKESGILYRFQRLILPSMPRCVEKTAFNSARLTDVYSAFFVLSVGWIASDLILFAEIIWHRRKKMKTKALKENLKYDNVRTIDGWYWLK